MLIMNPILRSFLSTSIKTNPPQCSATLTSVTSGLNEPNWTTSLIGINDNRCLFGVPIPLLFLPLHCFTEIKRLGVLSEKMISIYA